MKIYPSMKMIYVKYVPSSKSVNYDALVII